MTKAIERRLADNGVTWETVVVDEDTGGGSLPPGWTDEGGYLDTHGEGLSLTSGAALTIEDGGLEVGGGLSINSFGITVAGAGGDISTGGNDVLTYGGNVDLDGGTLFLGSGGLIDAQPGTIVTDSLDVSGALAHSGNSLGFFGTPATSKPGGVAVTAEAIHAALVTLGLIAGP